MQPSNQPHELAQSAGSQSLPQIGATPTGMPNNPAPQLAASGGDLLQQATLKIEHAFMQAKTNPYQQSMALQQIKNDYLAQRYNIQPNSVQL